MALRKTFQVENNFGRETILEDCYCKISSIAGDKFVLTIRILVIDQKLSRVLFEQSYNFVPSIEYGAENFIAQAYTHLKSLPEFAGATDC